MIRVIGVLAICLLAPTASAQFRMTSSNLETYVGNYPRDFFDKNPELTRRIRRLLGSKYNVYKQNFDVQTPIALEGTKDGYYLVLQGCKAHDCADHNAITIINLETGTIHTALFSRPDLRAKGKVKIFSEDNQGIPTSVERWQQFIYQQYAQ